MNWRTESRVHPYTQEGLQIDVDYSDFWTSYAEVLYERTKSDDIGSFLGDFLHGVYGATADPAAWYDWQACIKQITQKI